MNRVELFTGTNLQLIFDTAVSELPENLYIEDVDINKFGEMWVLKVYVNIISDIYKED